MTSRSTPENTERPTPAPLPIDPDLPSAQPRAVRRVVRALRHRWDILAAISAGGALGSAVRYAVAEAIPHAPGQIPWSTVAINLTGGFLLGLLMVFVLDVWPPTRYVRPLVGIGVLGGFTTFSTYTVETRDLLVAGQPASAATYLLITLLGGLLTVWLGIICARGLSGLAHRRRHGANHGDSAGGAADPSIQRRQR